MGVLLFIIFVGFVIWLVKKGKEKSALNQAADAFKAQHAGWDVYISPYDQAVIAINHDRKAVVLGIVPRHKAYPWSSLGSIEVVRDGTSITSTNRGSQIMGAAVGDLLLGPAGLLIGGLSGSRRTVQQVSQIALKIIVDDRTTPIFVVNFLRIPGAGVDSRKPEVKAAIHRAEHVHALLFNAMRTTVTAPSASAQLPAAPSKTDQIAQLWKLKEAGALTQGEFDEQKALLLGR